MQQKKPHIFFQNISAMVMAPTTHSLFLILLMLSVCALPSSSDDMGYQESLINFKNSLTNAEKLNPTWIQSAAPLCNGSSSNWLGVICRNNVFKGLTLDNMGLGGTIEVQFLSPLNLFSLSLINNSFSGPFPSDIKKLGKLRRLFLSHNNLSGEIPDKAFLGMTPLTLVDLANNFFSGKLPTSLIRVQLQNLTVQNNLFEGKIPDFWQENLRANFSNNRLQGVIPVVLSDEDATMFSGNLGLCGLPLPPCPKKWYKKSAFIAAASVAAAAVVLSILLLIWCRRRSRPMKYEKSVNHFKIEEKGAVITDQNGKLEFVRSGRERFELEDLLKASAEVLGSGSFGSSYKAVLLTGQPHVVRRFKQMSNVGKEEFYEHMTKLGRLSHPNLLPLVAFSSIPCAFANTVSNGEISVLTPRTTRRWVSDHIKPFSNDTQINYFLVGNEILHWGRRSSSPTSSLPSESST